MNRIALAILILILASFAMSCTVDESNVTPTQAQRLVALKEAYAKAVAAGDKEAMEKADRELDQFEAQVLQERAGPVAGTLAAISPALGWLSPLLIAGAPLLGKRGRRNAWNGIKAARKGDIVDAVLSVGRTLGALDSTPDSGAVARGEKVAVHPDELPSGTAVG